MTGPLAGLKILDFSTLIPGPTATLLLADLGADVVRVEAPHRFDLIRAQPPFADGQSVWHSYLNRNKRSLALDLKQPAAVGVVLRLVQRYDIVMEQFRPGVMDRLGVGYAALAAANPALIYCAISGYGQTGPYAQRAAHDLNLLALAGILSHSGRRGEAPPPLGIQPVDLGTGYAAALAVLAAVVQRQATGVGQMVDVSMFDTALAWNALAGARALAGGEEPAPEDGLLNGGGFYGCYATADGRYMSVASIEPHFWAGFCEAIERPDLVSCAYDTAPGVQAHMRAAVAAAIAAQPLAEWVERFAGLDICVEPVLTSSEALAHPQAQARSMVVETPTAGGAGQRQVAAPLRFSAATPAYSHTGATLGEHSAQILADAGYDEGEIAALAAAGVFG